MSPWTPPTEAEYHASRKIIERHERRSEHLGTAALVLFGLALAITLAGVWLPGIVLPDHFQWRFWGTAGVVGGVFFLAFMAWVNYEPSREDYRTREREARGAPKLQAEHYARLAPLAEALGVPLFTAPHDAEAQCAWFCQEDLADFVATTDWDALVMGVSRELQANDRDVLAAAAVLMGSDYGPGIQGVGPKKALKHAQECGGDLRKSHLANDVLPDCLPDWRETFQALTEPPVNDALRPTWTRPGKDAANVLQAIAKPPGGRSWPEALAQLSLLHDPARATSTPAAPTAQAGLGRWGA